MDEYQAVPPLPVPVPPRRAAIAAHAHLRELLLQGQLPPGMVLKQTEMARALGVGVIPVREAFRMLQQEGLIEVKPNKRAIVASADPTEQDALWAQRILLESLASRMTAGRLNVEELIVVRGALDRMLRASETDDYESWTSAHSDFHDVANRYAGDAINRQIRDLTSRTLRFMLLHGRRLPHSYQEAFDDHASLFAALEKGDPDLAQQRSGMHVGRPALVLLAQLAPSFEPGAVRASLVVVGAHGNNLMRSAG